MPEFNLEAKVTVSCWTKVEADTLEEAVKIAESRNLAEINIDGSFPSSECWHMDSDGVPFDVRIDQ